MDRISKMVTDIGTVLCSLAVVCAQIAPLCCRGIWYQPEEPDNFRYFLKER